MREDSLIYEAARLCYELGFSQVEVASILGVSPATLSRLLKKAREIGIVKITIQKPGEFNNLSLEISKEVEEKLQLKEVIIVPISARASYVRKEFGYAAAQWLQSQLYDGARIGFSGGRSVSEIIPFLGKSEAKVSVIQLMGGVSAIGKKIQADEIVRAAASILGGDCYVIHGPAIFSDEKSYQEFIRNPIILDVLTLFDSLDIAMIGVGTLEPDSPLMQCGFINQEEVDLLLRENCVGEICGRFFDQSGNQCCTGLAKRTLAIQLQQLICTPRVCAVAGGSSKISTIFAACRIGLLKTLITDIATAREIVRSNK